MQHGVLVSSTNAVVATCPPDIAGEIGMKMINSGLVSAVHALPDAAMILIPKQGVMTVSVTTTLANIVATLRPTAAVA